MIHALMLLLGLTFQPPTAAANAPAPATRLAEDLFVLTDAIGPRTAGSPAEREAQEWAMARLRALGLRDVRLDSTAPVDIGGGVSFEPPSWSWNRCVVQQMAPWPTTLIAAPALYSPPTNGPVRGRVRLAPLPRFTDTEVDAFVARHRGQLAGAFLLQRDGPVPVRRAPDVPQGVHSETHLGEMAAFVPAPPATPLSSVRPGMASSPAPSAAAPDPFALQRRLMAFLRDEGVVGLIGAGKGAAGAVAPGVVPVPPSIAPPPPAFDLTAEHYNRLLAFVQRGVPTELEVDLAVTQRGAGGVRNVLAELPGERDDEVVIVGAHLDSLHGGTGATDNAAGVVTLLEAVRMMAARPAPWRRTVRIALWGGEELGLHGSRDYIRRHFRGADGQANAAAGQVSAYLNLDYGGGAIRGVYLQGRAPLKPLFEAWFRELPGGPFVTTLRSALGSDQGAFERAGIPGLSFVQDPLNYDTQTHHTTMDLPDHVSTDVLAASARTLAALVERLAMAPSPLPRARQ